jgi:hypothetical protein
MAAPRRSMTLGVVALSCVIFQVLASQVEVQTLSEEEAPAPVASAGAKLTWKKMTADDKIMSKQQAEVSHFSGSMSTKEHSFAEQQGSEKELFALSSKDQELAVGQSTAKLGLGGARTLRYLTTPLSKTSAHDVNLHHLANIQKQADERARQLQQDLVDLQAPARKHDELHHLLNAVHEAITKNAEEDTELGEGMDMSVGKHERVEKAEQKARIEMTAETKRHQADIKTYRREMKEVVAKSNRVRMKEVRKAQAIVPAAVREYDQKAQSKKSAAKKRSITMVQQAISAYTKAEAAAIKDKQQLELRVSSRSNAARSEKSRVKMQSEAFYQKQLALFENASIKRVARAKKRLVEARSRLQDEERKNREEGLSRSKSMKVQFASMLKQIRVRMQKSISKLQMLEAKELKSAKATYKVTLRKGKKRIQLVKIQTTQSKKGAGIMLAESRGDASKADREKTQQLGVKLEFKTSERARKRKTSKQKRKIMKEENKFDLKIKREKKEIHEKEKVREAAMASKEGLTATEYKSRQMKWLNMVKKTARKNCHDAKREGILKAKAGRFATDRLSRMSQDTATMQRNVLEDVKSKGKQAYNRKERAAKTLKKVVAAQAKAMQASPGAYDASAIQKAATAFSKVAGPEKSQEEIIKEASAKAKASQTAAKKRTKVWAKKKAEKTAKNLKKAANRVCDKEQLKYEETKYRVRKRLGLASEAEHKALLKRQFEGKKWALNKVTVILGNKKKMSEASEKKKSQLSEKQKKSEKVAEKKEKAKLAGSKERQTKFAQASKKKEQTAKAKMKAAAAKRKAKIAEAKKLMQVAEKAFKTQKKGGHAKLKQGIAKIKASSRREEQKLGVRRKAAMSVLAKGGKSNLKAGFERAQKKSKESQTKARKQQKERVQKATKRRDDALKKVAFDTKQKVSELKVKLRNGKAAADKRMLRSKLVLSRHKQEAKKILAEAAQAGAGAKQNMIYEAKLKAEKLLQKSKLEVSKAMKAARRVFIKKVKAATAKYLKNIKATKEKMKAGLS